jgi:hypothetical protein
MLLLPFTDPITGQQTNELIMWDTRKFWTAQQEVPLTYIAEQEVNSEMTAWGTDGSNLFKMFQQPTNAITKVVQSKLWVNPGYDFTKTGMRVYGIVENWAYDAALTVSIDTDIGVGEQNSVSVNINNGDGGTDVFGPLPMGQQGKLIGFTATTNVSSGDLLSLMLREQDFMLNT